MNIHYFWNFGLYKYQSARKLVVGSVSSYPWFERYGRNLPLVWRLLLVSKMNNSAFGATGNYINCMQWMIQEQRRAVRPNKWKRRGVDHHHQVEFWIITKWFAPSFAGRGGQWIHLYCIPQCGSRDMLNKRFWRHSVTTGCKLLPKIF